MLTFTLLPATAVMEIAAFKLARINKHDSVLFRFCDIRRGTMKLLWDKGECLGTEDYQATRQLLEALNASIHHYDAFKTLVFNYRFFRQLRTLRAETYAADKTAKRSNNPEVLALIKKFKDAMVIAFLAYTPFIRSEVSLRFCIALSSLLALSVIRRIEKAKEYFTWLLEEINNLHNGNASRPTCS